MKVRAATDADLEAIFALERTVATAPHWPKGTYQKIVAEGGLAHCLIVAEEAAEIMGFAVGRIVGEVAELESVAVALPVRRKGVGWQLCQAIVAWAAELGAAGIELEVRQGSNAARELYARLGFYEVGRRRGYYREPADDAILMRLGRPALAPGKTEGTGDAGL